MATSFYMCSARFLNTNPHKLFVNFLKNFLPPKKVFME